MLKQTWLTLALLTLTSIASAQALPAHDISQYSPQCKIQVLQQIGWTIENGEQLKTDISADPCSAASLEQIQKSQILKLTAPANLTNDDIKRLDQTLQGGSSLCAYKMAYNKALEAATHGLDDNLWYSFDMKFISKDTIRLKGVKGWQQVSCSSDAVQPGQDACFQPAKGQFETAFGSLLKASYASECDTGLQLAELATIHELFKTKTSQYFAPEELFIGNWFNTEHSQSVIHGASGGRRLNDTNAMRYSTFGYQIMPGLPGFIGSAIPDESLLDDKTNRNENFIIVKTSPEAQAALKKHGGLVYYDFLMKQIWTMSKAFKPDQLRAIQAHRKLPAGTPDATAFLKALQDPFLQDTLLYIKGMGFVRISDVLVKLARVNPRMPYGISLDPEATHAEIFDRWIKSKLDACR